MHIVPLSAGPNHNVLKLRSKLCSPSTSNGAMCPHSTPPHWSSIVLNRLHLPASCRSWLQCAYADGAPCLEGLEEVNYLFPFAEGQTRRFPSYASPIFHNHPVSYNQTDQKQSLYMCGCITCTLAYVSHRLFAYFFARRYRACNAPCCLSCSRWLTSAAAKCWIPE